MSLSWIGCWQNVLENAAKFSPPRSVVTISVTSGPDRVRVSVTDQGPGIPKRDRSCVFEPFVRGEDTGAGPGLGLSIAHAIAIAHGGRMWVADSPTGGASVVFELPVMTGLESSTARAAERTRGAPASCGSASGALREDGMSAELLAQRRSQLGGHRLLLARCESREQ